MSVRRYFLYIELRPDRDIRFKNRFSVFRAVNAVHKTVRRKTRSVGGGYLLRRVQTELNRKYFAAAAGAEVFVLFEYFIYRDYRLLPLVIKAHLSSGYAYCLSVISKYNGLWSFIKHRTVRRFGFGNLIFSEIKFFCYSRTAFICCNGIYHFAFGISFGAVRRNNILRGCNGKDSAFKSFNLIQWGIHSVFFRNRPKDFSGLFNCYPAFLRHIVFFHCHYRLCTVYLKRHRLAVKHIPVSRALLDYFIFSVI